MHIYKYALCTLWLYYQTPSQFFFESPNPPPGSIVPRVDVAFNHPVVTAMSRYKFLTSFPPIIQLDISCLPLWVRPSNLLKV